MYFAERFHPKRTLRGRHISVILLFIFIILESLILACCTTSSVASYYLTQITYTEYGTSSNSSDIQELRLRMGYFSSCLSVNQNSWSCGINAYDMLLSEPEFDSSVEANVDLYNLVVETGDFIRSRCMTPYILLVSIITSFLILSMMAFISPGNHVDAYKWVFFVCYISLSLTVIAAVWQETNVTTANLLLSEILDNFYTVKTDYGSYARGAIWTGVGIQVLISIFAFILALQDSISWAGRFNNYWQYQSSRY